jgi:hypothetical protein
VDAPSKQNQCAGHMLHVVVCYGCRRYVDKDGSGQRYRVTL